VNLARRITSVAPASAVYTDDVTRSTLEEDPVLSLSPIGSATLKGAGTHELWEIGLTT
jgi:class 3 adenylate cyclase